MPAPAVSVCVPTFNGAQYLPETLASIRAQTFSDYEVLIVDDQSTDDTVEIASRFAATDPRVRVIRNDTRAGSSARNANRAASHARGEWVKFVYQDDLIAPSCLARLLEAGSRGRLVFSWHAYLFQPDVDASVRDYYTALPTLEASLPGNHAHADDFSDAVLRHWYTNFVGPTSSAFVRRDCFMEHGGFTTEIRGFPDLEFWIRVGNREGIAIVPERLVDFRVHNGSISASMRREQKGPDIRRDLETLLLHLLLMYSPAYAGIRARALREGSPVSAPALLESDAVDARWSALDMRFRDRRSGRAAMDAWQTFCRTHPEVLMVLEAHDRRLPIARRIRDRIVRFVKASL